MEYAIRATEPHEWEQRKQLRLASLLDPASSVAFVNTYETESAFPEETWQRRGTTPGFVAVSETGEWVGSATVLVEVGAAFPIPQTHIVGVYMAPEGRASGLSERMLRAAIDWSWELPEKIGRVRLWVHEDNTRAQAFYARLGFTRTGETMAFPLDTSQTEYEMELPRPV